MMHMGGLESQRIETQLENGADTLDRHPDYSVIDPGGRDVGIGLLSIYYGDLWEKVLDRLDHKIDGHLFAISHNSVKFNIYRKGLGDRSRRAPLRLVE
jgi:hypothetical protein